MPNSKPSFLPLGGGHNCSFCGRPSSQTTKLFAGENAFICGERVQLFGEIFKEPGDEAPEHSFFPRPAEIKRALGDYVVGQDKAKKALSVAVYNHYKRIYSSCDRDLEINKSNILLVGPTGVGKTLLAQTLARLLKVPFAIADATSLTETGYVGEDVENILLRLLQAANYDLKIAQKGIVYIDESDKIARKSENPSITRDVSRERVEQALLKILAGSTMSIPPQGGRKHPYQDFIRMDTKNILFLAGGSFEGLDKIIMGRRKRTVIGFLQGEKPRRRLRRGNNPRRPFKVRPDSRTRWPVSPGDSGRAPFRGRPGPGSDTTEKRPDQAIPEAYGA